MRKTITITLNINLYYKILKALSGTGFMLNLLDLWEVKKAGMKEGVY